MRLLAKKRSRKFRGYRRHGHGMKGRRGKGLRGGRGMAGLCKHRYIWMIKYAPDHWGTHGFTSHHPKVEIRAITLKELDEKLQEFIREGHAREENGKFYVDLESAGYNRLLATGKVSRPVFVKVEYYSSRVEEKLREAGGGILKDE